MKKLFQKMMVLGAIFSSPLVVSAQGNAYVQVVHNCAAPGADSVDIYINGTRALSSFKFRTATSFIALPSGLTLNVGVAPAHSTRVADTLKNFVLGPLAMDSNYIVVASGVVGTGFAANPNSISTALDLKVIAHAYRKSTPGNVSIGVFHGATDAPAVDVDLTSSGSGLVNNIQYGQFQGYLTVPATWYPISIAPTGTHTYVANYTADLSSLGDSAAVVLASGFLSPSTNNNGSAFGLIAVLPNGTVILLPQQQNSLVQVIHNSPDPAADSVDIYIDGTIAIPNFKFRTATPFIPLLSNVNHSVAVAPAHSSSVSQALATFSNINLKPDTNYVVTATGLVGTGFAANPNGRSTAFTLLIKADAEIHALAAGNFDFFGIHGSPDAPSVNIAAESVATLISGFRYTDQTSYYPVPATTYVIDVIDSTSGTVVARYNAPLAAFADSSAVILASGFLNPSANKNGPAFGLWVALPNGGNLIPLSKITGIDDVNTASEIKCYPNPSSGMLYISLGKEKASQVSIADLHGNVVKTIATEGESMVSTNVSELSDGMYLLHIQTASGSVNAKFSLIR